MSEAIIISSDKNTVQKATRFVLESAYSEVGPERLRNLEGIYEPPKGGGGKRRQINSEFMWAAQLVSDPWSSAAQSAADEGRPTATRKLINSATHKIDEFQWPSKNPFKTNESIIQLVTDGRGTNWIHPVASIVHLQSFNERGHQQTIVYVETPKRKRAKKWRNIQKQFEGHGAALLGLKKLRRLRNPSLLEGVRKLWV